MVTLGYRVCHMAEFDLSVAVVVMKQSERPSLPIGRTLELRNFECWGLCRSRGKQGGSVSGWIVGQRSDGSWSWG